MCLQNYNIFFIHANFLAKIAFQAAFFTLIFAFLAAKYINFTIKHAGSICITRVSAWVYFFLKKVSSREDCAEGYVRNPTLVQ